MVLVVVDKVLFFNFSGKMKNFWVKLLITKFMKDYIFFEITV